MLRVIRLAGANGGQTKRFSLNVGRQLNVTVTLLGDPRLLVLSRPAGNLSPLKVRRLQRLVHSFPYGKVAIVLSDRVLSRIRRVTSRINVVTNNILKCRKRLHTNRSLRRLFVSIVHEGNGRKCWVRVTCVRTRGLGRGEAFAGALVILTPFMATLVGFFTPL